MNLNKFERDKIFKLSQDKKFSNLTSKKKYTTSQCGDEIVFSILLENNRIKDINFKAQGCMILKASATLLSYLSLNEERAKIESLVNLAISKDYKNLSEISKSLEIFNSFLNTKRFECFILPFIALKKEFKD